MNKLEIYIIILAYSTINSFNLSGQEFVIKSSCNFFSSAEQATVTYQYPSEKMTFLWNQLIDAAGETQNFIGLFESNEVSNAMAIIDQNGVRAILYNPSFVQKLESASATRWSSMFLLAHELGHHYLDHSISGSYDGHEDEFEADAFATKILVELGADANETGVAIANFIKDNEEASRTHPSAEARTKRVESVWLYEMKKITVVDTAYTKKQSIVLDRKALKKNPWNIVEEAKAVIDGEKIEIRYTVPENSSDNYKVCVFANSESLSPGKNPGSLIGLDNLKQPYNPGSGQLTIWNYSIDRYKKQDIISPGEIRFYVFDKKNLPKPPKASSAFFGGIASTAGLGLGIWGISRISEGLDIYNNEYRITFDEETYNVADEKYFSGQIIAYSGAGLAAIGAIILNRRSRRAKEYRKCNCLDNTDRRASLNPSFTNDGLGITFTF